MQEPCLELAYTAIHHLANLCRKTRHQNQMPRERIPRAADMNTWKRHWLKGMSILLAIPCKIQGWYGWWAWVSLQTCIRIQLQQALPKTHLQYQGFKQSSKLLPPQISTIRRPRPAGRAPGKPSVPFLGTFRESGELLCICDIACCFSRLGSLTTVLTWLRLLGSPGSCCAFATLRAVFPDWVHSPRFLPGCGRVHVQGCRDGHFVFASRLGSLSTVFTWLRSRACAGMQGEC